MPITTWVSRITQKSRKRPKELLTHMGSECPQSDSSVEPRISIRILSGPSLSSTRWRSAFCILQASMPTQAFSRRCWAPTTQLSLTRWTTPRWSTVSDCAKQSALGTSTWTWVIWRNSCRLLRAPDLGASLRMVSSQWMVTLLWWIKFVI